jgi:hypothetical protein
MAARVELRVFRCLLLCVFTIVSGAVAQQADDNHPRGKSEVPRAGVNGVTSPKCIYCPQPKYSKEALKANFSGVVLLDVTITTDGKIINPIMLKSPGLGERKGAGTIIEMEDEACSRSGRQAGELPSTNRNQFSQKSLAICSAFL